MDINEEKRAKINAFIDSASKDTEQADRLKSAFSKLTTLEKKDQGAVIMAILAKKGINPIDIMQFADDTIIQIGKAMPAHEGACQLASVCIMICMACGPEITKFVDQQMEGSDGSKQLIELFWLTLARTGSDLFVKKKGYDLNG